MPMRFCCADAVHQGIIKQMAAAWFAVSSISDSFVYRLRSGESQNCFEVYAYRLAVLSLAYIR